jgi:hypothetical protein
VPELIASFSNFTLLLQYAVHCADAADVATLIEKPGKYLSRSLIDKSWRMQFVERFLVLFCRQSTRGALSTKWL